MNDQTGMNTNKPILLGLKAKKNQKLECWDHIISYMAVPATISISQMCESLSALDRTSLPNLFTGKTTLKHAMLDIDNPIFAVLASELRISINNQVEHHCSTFLF